MLYNVYLLTAFKGHNFSKWGWKQKNSEQKTQDNL